MTTQPTTAPSASSIDCTCGDADTILIEGNDPLCATHGLDLSTVEGLAAALRFGGVEVGSVGGENVRAHYAARMLPLLEAKFAAVWREAYTAGIVDEQNSQDFTGGQVAPNRANPYQKRT